MRLLLALCLACTLSAQWRDEEVGVGVLWRARHDDPGVGARECVNVLVLDPKATPRPRLRLCGAKGKQHTSALAQASPAIAAVNGGYFNVKTGEPSGLLRIDGKTISDESAARWCALAIDKDEHVELLPARDARAARWQHARAAGPMLVQDGKISITKGFESIAGRHPRTAIGLTKDARILLVTVDGRDEQSAGMTLEELAKTMAELGCVTAMNLDGGGSSTLWVRGQPDLGVVNHPCDDKVWGHLGERAVSDAILVEALDVIVIDDDLATLVPPERFTQRSAGGPFLGAGYAFAAEGEGACARFQVRVELPGQYALFARWPIVPAAARLEIGQDTVHAAPAGAAGAWLELTRLDVEAARELRIQMSGGAGPFSVDALRLVQRTRK